MLERLWATRLVPLVATAAGLSIGLLGPGSAPGQALPGVLIPPLDGTVVTFERMSNGSFRTMKGQVVRKWTKRVWNGRTVFAIVSDDGSGELSDPETCATMATLEKGGRIGYTYDPPIGYAWPLEVGKTWTLAYRLSRTHPFNESIPIKLDFRVEAYEDVVVPAGAFKAFKVVSNGSLGGGSQTWVVPALGLCGEHALKRIDERPASHWLGDGHRESIMVSRVVPGR